MQAVKLPESALLGGEDGDLIPRGLWEHSRAYGSTWSEEMAGATQRPLALISACTENSRGGLVKDVGMVDSGFLSTSVIMRGTGILDDGGVGFSIRLESGPSGFAFCSSDCFIVVCYFRSVC